MVLSLSPFFKILCHPLGGGQMNPYLQEYITRTREYHAKMESLQVLQPFMIWLMN